jgi:hypothetical protein
MKKNILIALAILAVSTSGALAKHKMAKPKAPAATATMGGPMLQGTAADKKMYMKNMHDSGMKKK